MKLTIDMDRLSGELEALSRISDAPAPAVTRVLFTPTEVEGRRYVKRLFAEAGLAVREDAAGNIFACWEGTDPGLPAVATGSHIDAIPFAGMYDGTVGVLGALEAFRALQAAGFKPRRSLELITFTSEEPTRFGAGCLGSRVLSGSITPEALAALTDDDGTTFEEARTIAGYGGDTGAACLPEGHYAYFVELHIEQGPRLEAAGIPIGIVTAIAAPATLRFTLEGKGGHAGALMMKDRHDALLAGAELALAAEKAAHDSLSPHAVATTGIFTVHPGASNSVPSRVVLTIDIRDTDRASRDHMVAQVQAAHAEIKKRRGVRGTAEVLNLDPPATSDSTILAAAAEAAEALGLPSMQMVSHAYHDTSFMAQVCPVAMLFVPSKDGHSHRPEEYTSPQEIAQGVAVLAHTLAHLAAK